MGISKDLSQTPYFDDYNEDKNFHRVLFKPATAVQARELNQMQTMLQDQIERFGENILIDGTIISGGNFTEINPLPYVKVLDNDTDNRPIVLSNYVNLRLRGKTSGVTAKVVTFKTGFQSQTDKNTLYVKYTAANGTDDQSTFDTAEQIEVLNNDDTVAVTLTVAGTRDVAAIGNGYGVTCGEGILFQKGHFIRFYEQIEIVSRYDTAPTGVVIGFDITESIIDSFQDTSLLDNASGFNNEQAPGADRLKLTPDLVVLTKAEAAARENFFVIQEYESSRIVRRNDRTRFNSIGQEMARRTTEESGNYALTPYAISVNEHSSNNSLVSVGVGTGVSYVEGNRVEVLSEVKVDVEKATETFSVEQQNITTAYGNYYNVSSIEGVFPVATLGEVELYDSVGAAVVGTARIRAITATSDTNWRMYLFNVQGDNISSATQIRKTGVATIVATIALDDNSDPQRIQDADRKVGLYNIGKGNIEEITGTPDYITYVEDTFQVGTVTSTGTATFNRDSDWFWRDTTVSGSTELDYIIFAANGDVVPTTAFSIGDVTLDSDGGRTITINSSHATTSETFTILSPAKRKVVPGTKELETIYVRVDADTHSDLASGAFSLGVPDAFEIVDIWKGANTTFTEADAGSVSSIVSVKNQYVLYPNQKDGYYDYSYIKKKSSASFTSGDTLLIKANVFKKAAASTTGYWAVNSYPVDDSTSPAADTIKTEEIPIYEADNGTKYNLRDALDFRPYPTGLTYNTTDATASVINDTIETLSDGVGFGVAEVYYPAPNENFEGNFDYYVGRIDKIFIDELGSIGVIQGAYSDTPQPPSDPEKGMVIAEVNVTPFPSLPASVANRTNHPEYAISFSKPNNRRYTMKDISKIDKRLKNLEYYTVLNALESDAEEYVVQDKDGLNRFKNGIFVENFKNLLNANVNDPAFSASVSRTQKEMAPRIHQYYLDLEVDSVNGLTQHEDVITLPYSSSTMINQPFATRTKSCTTDFYRWTGTMRIFPEYDGGSDTTVAPDIQLPDTGLVDAFSNFTEALGELAMFQDQVQQLSSVTQTIGAGAGFQQNQTTTVTQTTTQVMDVTDAGDPAVQTIGDFVTDVSFKPYLRSQDVEIEIFGMMPNKRVYFYFDEEDVNAHIATAQLLTDDQITANEAANDQTRLVRTSDFSATNEIKADANGVVRAIFRIPEETFYVGDRKLEVMSQNAYNERDNAVTYAVRVYRGFNFSSTVASLTAAPRQPVFNFATNQTQETTVTLGARFAIPPTGRGGGCDPIAQTFYVESEFSSDTVVQISSVDVYFSAKSSVGNGVSVQIYETLNGYPSSLMVPYGAARKESTDVNTSDGTGTSLSATTFTFPNLVTLNTNKEYALVVHPDGSDPDYRIWTAKTGESDIISGDPVTQNVSAGVLFTSTNKRAWTPYQDENMAFKINKATYTSKTGSVTLTNKDHEFLDISSYSGGAFKKGEKVFKVTSEPTRTFSGDTITVTNGSRTITCATASTFTNVNDGDTIVVDYGVSATPRYQSFLIEAKGTPTSGGELTTREVAYGTTNADVTFYKTIVGTMDYFYESPIDFLIRMILTDSTADGDSSDVGDKFQSADTVIGIDSNATATLSSITDLPVNLTNLNLYKTNYSRTRTSFKFFTDATNFINVEPGNTINFNKSNYSIKSKSNLTSSDTPLKIECTLNNVVGSNQTVDSSPIFDYQTTNGHFVEYVINDDTTGETGNQGNADTKYVTSMVTLSDQMDATDLAVLLTAYRPIGTDIKVYGRFQNSADPRAFANIEWSELEKEDSTNLISSSANRYDFKEISYRIPEGTATDGGGAVRINQDNLNYQVGSSVYTSYKYFAIKIVMTTSQQYSIPRVKDMRAIALA